MRSTARQSHLLERSIFSLIIFPCMYPVAVFCTSTKMCFSFVNIYIYILREFEYGSSAIRTMTKDENNE